MKILYRTRKILFIKQITNYGLKYYIDTNTVNKKYEGRCQTETQSSYR